MSNPTRPRADDVLDAATDDVVEAMRVSLAAWVDAGCPANSSPFTAGPLYLAALRAAASAPDGAPLVILGDGTLGWLEQMSSFSEYSQTRDLCWTDGSGGVLYAVDTADMSDMEPLWRLAGPQGGTE